MRRPSPAGVRALGFLASVAAAIVVHLPVLRVPFLGDDLEGVVRATEPGRVPGVGGSAGHWRPLANLSLVLNRGVGDLDPLGYHLLNVVVHGVVAALVGLAAVVVPRFVDGASLEVARRGADRRERAGAVVAAGLFLVLPSHTEAVVWIAGRGDVMCAAFAVGSLLVWIRGRSGAPGSGVARTSAALSGVLLVGALAAKEAALVVPVVASVLESARALVAHRRGESPWTWASAARPWPLYAVAVGWSLLRWLAGGAGLVPTGDDSTSPVALARRSAGLLARSLLPAMPSGAWIVVAVLAVLAVAALAAVVAGARRRLGDRDGVGSRAVCVAALATAAAIAVLPAAPLGVAATTSAGERLTYLPSAFAVLALVTAWGALLRRHAAVAASVAALVLACSTVALLAAERRWVRAGELADSITSSLSQLPRDRPALLLELPERWDGVPVMENAAGATLALLHGWTDPSVLRQPLGTTVTGPEPSTRARPGGGGSWVLSPEQPGDRITARYPPDPGDPFVSSVDGGGRRATVVVAEVPPGGIWRVERGRLVAVDAPR